MAEVKLTPLEANDREQFITDNQTAFNYGALEEFGVRDEHFEEDNNVCAELTADIVVNKNVLNSRDSLGADAKRLLQWVPIGNFYHHFSGRIKNHMFNNIRFLIVNSSSVIMPASRSFLSLNSSSA